MTDPKLAVSTPYGRHYAHPDRAEINPSITNIKDKKGIAGLKWWAAREAATWAADNWERLRDLTREERIELIRKAPFSSTSAKQTSADVGDIVHDWVDRTIKGETIPAEEIAHPFYMVRDEQKFLTASAARTAQSMWRQFTGTSQEAGFLGKCRPKWLASEFTVWSDKHGFAGTGDWIAELYWRGEPCVTLGDTKCMTPDTLMTMADGTEKRAGNIHHGDQIAAWDDLLNEAVPARVLACGDNGIHPVVTISTKCGRCLTVTLDHPVLTSRGWIKAVDLTEKDAIRVAGWIPEGEYDADQAYFLGLVAGDGSVGSGKSVKITNTDTRIVTFLAGFGAQYDLRLQRDNRFTYTLVSPGRKIGRNPVNSIVRQAGLFGTHSATKFVPDEILRGGAEAWLQFLAGYLDTDGCVRGEYQGSPRRNGVMVRWTSKSERLIRQCQSMLTGLGVRSSVSVLHSKYQGRPYIHWALSVRDRTAVRRLQAIIPSRGTRTHKLIEATVPPRGKRDTVTGTLEWDRVVSVKRSLIDQSTVWIEVAGYHTHITGGIVSHNTGKNVYADMRYQLAALAKADFILEVDDNGEFRERPLPKIRRYAILHLRPRSYQLVPVNPECIDSAFGAFLGLKTVFDDDIEWAEKTFMYSPKIEVHAPRKQSTSKRPA